MKNHLLGLPTNLQFTYDNNKNSSFLNNKDADPNSTQAIEKNIAITNTYNESNLTRDINFLMDYAIECNEKKHPNQIIKKNGEKALFTTTDTKEHEQSQISSLDCYLLWMVFNYDFDSKALFSISKQVESTRSPYDSTKILKNTPYLYETFLMTTYDRDIPYQYSDPLNSNTYDGKPMKSRAFFYSKLNTILNNALGRIRDGLDTTSKFYAEDDSISPYKDGKIHYIYDYKTGIGINVQYKGTRYYDKDIYEMVLPNGVCIDIDEFGDRIKDLGHLEESTQNISSSQTNFLLASQTLYSYYGCILKDFQDLCVKLRAYKNAQANQKEAKKTEFFNLFRSIMQRRIKGEIDELKAMQSNTALNNSKKYKYVVGIDGFYSPYYIKLLINSMALKKAMVDTFGSSVGLKEIQKLFDLKEIGVLFNLHISKDFQLYRTSRFYEEHAAQAQQLDEYNRQLEEESRLREESQQTQQALNIIQQYRNILPTPSAIDMDFAVNLSQMMLPKINVSNTQQAMSNELDDKGDANGQGEGNTQGGKLVIDGASQLESQKQKEEADKLEALEYEKKKKANEQKTKIILWSTIGLLGAAGIGYYVYQKRAKEQ